MNFVKFKNLINVVKCSNAHQILSWNLQNHLSSFTQVQCKKYFPDEHFHAPITSPEYFDEVKDVSIKDFKNTQFSPASVNDNCSVFYDPVVDKLRALIMIGGQKALARQLLEKTFYEIKRIQYGKYLSATTEEEKQNIILDPVVILHKAIENCTPLLNVTHVKKGAKIYQVPIPLSNQRGRWMSMKWLLEAGRDKGTKEHLHFKLSKELVDAAHNEGRVYRKKQDLHKLCEANRAYAHFAWS